MQTTDYEKWVEARCQPYTNINYCIIALNEEAGEVAGWYKKHTLRGNPLGNKTHEDLKGELGDVLFYLTRLAAHHGWSLSDVMEHNKTKIEERVKKGMKIIA